MNAVVSVQGDHEGGISRATRYVSERDRFVAREGEQSRPLFSDKEENLTYTQADHHLTQDRTGPDKSEIIHLTFSVTEDSFRDLGDNDSERKESLRLVVRESMHELEEVLNKGQLRWVAGIHLNTMHPHAHILILKTEQLRRIPRDLLPRRDNGKQATTPRRENIREIFEKHLQIAIERIQERDAIRFQKEQEIADRRLLGNELIASARFASARESLQNAHTFGESFRFKVNDQSTELTRKLSETDIVRRSQARADRAIAEQKPRGLEERREAKINLATSDIARHGTTISEIELQREKTIRAMERGVDRAEREYERTKFITDEVRIDYARRGLRVPTPILAGEDLSKLQHNAIDRRDDRTLRSLEELRRGLRDEKLITERSPTDLARLSAQLYVAQTDLRVTLVRQENFESTRHLRQWEIDGHPNKWSMMDLDRQLEHSKDEAKVFGKYTLHLSATSRAKAAQTVTEVTQIREQVREGINAERNKLSEQRTRAESLVSTLLEIRNFEEQRLAEQNKTMPQAKFEKHEIERLDQSAEILKDTQILVHVKAFESVQNLPSEVVSRDTAREVIASLSLREDTERVERFQSRSNDVPVVVTDKGGNEITKTYNQVYQPNPILRAITSFFDSKEQVSLRDQVREARDHEQTRLTNQQRASEGYQRTVTEMANQSRESYQQQFPDSQIPRPSFTPGETVRLEIYAERQTDQAERSKYLELAQLEGTQARLGSSREDQIDRAQTLGEHTIGFSEARTNDKLPDFDR